MSQDSTLFPVSADWAERAARWEPLLQNVYLDLYIWFCSGGPPEP